MTQEHPITPPSELVEKWYEAIDNSSTSWKQELTTQAARWGADQELEACCQEVHDWYGNGSRLRDARRPKPPSLKKRALQAWAAVEAGTDDQTAMAVIRRALEQLDD